MASVSTTNLHLTEEHVLTRDFGLRHVPSYQGGGRPPLMYLTISYVEKSHETGDSLSSNIILFENLRYFTAESTDGLNKGNCCPTKDGRSTSPFSFAQGGADIRSVHERYASASFPPAHDIDPLHVATSSTHNTLLNI